MRIFRVGYATYNEPEHQFSKIVCDIWADSATDAIVSATFTLSRAVAGTDEKLLLGGLVCFEVPMGQESDHVLVAR